MRTLKEERVEALIHISPAPTRDALKAITEACHRQSVAPLLVEGSTAMLKALDTSALLITVLSEGVTDGDLVLAEQLLQKASDLKLPCLAFIAESNSQANGGGKLQTFVTRLKADATTHIYQSITDLRAAIIDNLAQFHEMDLTTFHFVNDIPEPPNAYTAHPYTLLPTDKMMGRKSQLDVLSEWITATDHEVRILNVVAIGGMGKSAMTWKWYSDIAPQIMKPMAGRMWWSFYESDAYWENFVIRALAYVTKSDEAEIREITPPERERELLEVLDREPYLIVLDGIERMMVAYARLDAVRIDDDALDEQTQNQVAGAIGVPPNAKQSMFSPNRLRKTADPRAGAFLRKLATVRASRILVSSRLYPADLQSASGHPIRGAFAMFLTGLDDDDAIALWRSFGCSGERDEMLKIFKTFDNYPLLIRALAGEVSRFKDAPGDFAAWRKAHPRFAPLKQAPEQVKSHVMSYALSGLTDPQRKTLDTIAAFRMPSYFDALSSLLVKGKGADSPDNQNNPTAQRLAAAKKAKDEQRGMGSLVSKLRGEGKKKQAPETVEKFNRFETEAGLDSALLELENRGLIGWDRHGNRYDLHPIVRGVAWNSLDQQAKRGLYSKLNAHFGSLPPISIDDIHTIDDLTGSIEMYNTLIGLGEYDEAFALYSERLHTPMLRRLNASRQRAELLELLFPDGPETMPKISRPAGQARALNALALAYHTSGQPAQAAQCYYRAITLAESENNFKNVSIGLGNLSDVLRLTGNLRVAEAVANRALLINRAQEERADEAVSLQFLGLVHLSRGSLDESRIAFQRALKIHVAQASKQLEGVCSAFLAQHALYAGDGESARNYADTAWELADHLKYEADYVRAARLQGSAALALNDLDVAEERLTHALTRARAGNLTEQELAALIDLAELNRRRGNVKAVRTLLEDCWEPADRGPYRLLHAEAYMVLAALESDLNVPDAVKQVATTIYYLSWCDGEPYAYPRGLSMARELLRGLNTPEPDDLTKFDEAQFGAYLPAEINPEDEYYVE